MKLFTIPNLITLANLGCGFLAIVFAFQGNLVWAAYLVGVAAVLDFLDGFAARLLKQYSPIGKELDSLADMVTFGVVPGFIMFGLLQHSFIYTSRFFDFSVHPFRWALVAFLIPAFSALRLAKFNVDQRQSESFIGVPTPANAILICSLPLIIAYPEGSQSEMMAIILNPYLLFAITVVTSIWLVIELPLFSLKVKTYGWKGNELRYSFIAASVLMLILLKFVALPLIIVLYVLLSVISYFVKRTT